VGVVAETGQTETGQAGRILVGGGEQIVGVVVVVGEQIVVVVGERIVVVETVVGAS